MGGDEICSDPYCVKVTEKPTGEEIECIHNCNCPGAMICNGIDEVCEGELTSSTCVDYGQSNWLGTCDPNADRKTKCTQGQDENGPNGKYSCLDDCGCSGGRVCSAFGWCQAPVAGNTCAKEEAEKSSSEPEKETCNPNADRVTKCTADVEEWNGPFGEFTCYDDCGCSGGRWCSDSNYCQSPVPGNTCNR